MTESFLHWAYTKLCECTLYNLKFIYSQLMVRKKKKKRKKEQPVKLVSECFVVLQALSFSRFNLKQNDANINKTGRAAVLF